MNENALLGNMEYKNQDPNRNHQLRQKQNLLDARGIQRFQATNEVDRI